MLRKQHRGEVGAWTAIIAPALGAAALTVGCVFVVQNFSLVTGSNSTINGLLPLVLLAAALLGIWVGYVRKAEVELDQAADEIPALPPTPSASAEPAPVSI